MRVLVVAAHPDDETLGCGATLAKLADAGNDVTALVPLRRCDPRGMRDWDALARGFETACSTLGVRPVLHDDLLDETRAEPDVHVLHDRILPWVEVAELVLTHWAGDVNQVHRGVARAVEIATRPFRRRRDVACFEIPTSTDQAFGGAVLPFAPNAFVLVTAEQVRRKCRALEAYPGELLPGRTVEDVERLLRARGAAIGADFAEAFVATRIFR